MARGTLQRDHVGFRSALQTLSCFVAVPPLSLDGCWFGRDDTDIHCVLSQSCRLVSAAHLHTCLHFSFAPVDVAVIHCVGSVAKKRRGQGIVRGVMLPHPRFWLWSLSCCVRECNASEDRAIMSLVWL